MVASLDKKVGRGIAELRRRNNWSQEDLAERANLTTLRVGVIERGVHKQTLCVLLDICHAFGMTLGQFIKLFVEDGDAIPHPCQDSLPIMLRKQAD